MEIPKGTVTMFAFFRIVTQIPRQAGATYAYDYGLEASEMNLKANYRVQVIGKETIISDGVPVKCWKIKQTGQGIHEQFYWVTEDGLLQRVLIDGRKQMDLQIGD